MLENGYIKLYRSLVSWEWYGDRNTTALFIHLLLTVNYEERRWKGMEIKRGQRLCSRASLARELRLTEKEVRTALEHLKKTGEVASRTSPQGTVLTVLRFDAYQNGAGETANEGPAEGQPWANEGPVNKKDKKAEKEEKERTPLKGGKKEKAAYGEFGNVYLTEEEREKLMARFGNNETARAVEELSAYCQSKGKRYADYYATLVNWCKRNGEKMPGRAKEKSFAELAAEMEGKE